MKLKFVNTTNHRPISKLVGFWIFILSFCVCYGQNNPIVYTNFAAYLTNRTWLNEMRIDLSQNHFSNKKEGFSTWKASLQSNGFFFQCVSNSPFHAYYTYGESSEEYWQVSQREIDFAKKDESFGGNESNRLQRICSLYKQKISDMLNCGIYGLDTQNITWLSKDQFTSPFLDYYTGKPTPRKIQVKIDSFYEGLPASMEYKLTDESSQKTLISSRIICRYDSPVLPPTEIVIEDLNGSEKPNTNIIRSIAFGLREEAVQGFMPSNFFFGDVSPKIRGLESNGLAYIVQTNGTLQVTHPTYSPEEQELTKGHIILIRIVLVIFLILPLIAILFKKISSKHKKQ